MAGEYSRELSAKVFAGQCRLIELGYRQGGPAGFGLRRVLIDQTGSIKSELTRGEHKNLQTDRGILMPGPASTSVIFVSVCFWIQPISLKAVNTLTSPTTAVRLHHPHQHKFQ
jgi:hypothetical protein